MLVCAFVALLVAPTSSFATPGTTSVSIVDQFGTSTFSVIGDERDNSVTIEYDNGSFATHADDTIIVRETQPGGELAVLPSNLRQYLPAFVASTPQLCAANGLRTVVTCVTPRPGVDYDPSTPAVVDTINPVTAWNIDGQAGNDDLRLIGDAHGIDALGNGADYLVTMSGGPGNDVIYGSDGVEKLYGDGGQDSVDAPARDGNDEIHDGRGKRNDKSEFITGGAGNDLLVQPALTNQNPVSDQDSIDLGAGTDTVTYAARDADHAIKVTLSSVVGYDDGTPGEFDLLGSDVERVIGSAGDDEFIGTTASAVSVTYDGGPGDDLFRTSTPNESINGGVGTDTVTYASQGSVGVDVTADDLANDGVTSETDNVHSDVERIVGSAQSDDLQGAPIAGCRVAGAVGDDTVRAPAGAGCVLEGGDGSDTIIGGSGDDVVHPGASSTSAPGDTVTFGGGVDTVDYGVVGIGGGTDVVQVTAAATTAGISAAGCDGLGVGATSANKSVGDLSSGPDVDSYTDAPERLVGTNGNDTLCAGGSATELVGGLGGDRLYGWTGNDTIDGGPGSDAVYGQEGNDTLRGGEDDDAVNGGAGNDNVDGGAGDDTVRGGAGSDAIQGGDGNDTLTEMVFSTTPSVGGTQADGADTLDGGPGDDLIDGALGDDRIVCSAGIDTTRDTGSGTDTVDCSGLGAGANVTAAAGIDRVIGSQFSDTIVGSDTPLTIDGSGGDDRITGSAAPDAIDGGTGSDVVNGGEGSDALVGGVGGDTLSGSGGDDTLEGGSGADVLRGGAGTDTISYALRASGVTITAGGGADDGIAGELDDVGGDIEVISGSGFNDVISAGSVPSTITGGDGNDRIVGSSAGDSLDGGAGNDAISGAGGDDTITGVFGSDSLDGGSGNDTVAGGEGDDTLIGGDGADTLTAGAGSDTLDGGAGADALAGGDGVDTVTYAARSKPVVVTVGGTAGDGEKNELDDVQADIERVLGGRGSDVLVGTKGNQQLFGGAGNDKLDGGVGSDILRGGAGNDTIIGGAGVDQLFGEAGNDVLRAKDKVGKEAVDGGPGKDRAQYDARDRVKAVEKRLK